MNDTRPATPNAQWGDDVASPDALIKALYAAISGPEPGGEAFMRGINSIHLLHKDSRWWIVHVFWDNESADNPIPEAYCPQPA